MQILAKDQNKVWNLRLLKLISTRLIFVQRSRQLVLTHDDSGLSIIDRNVCFKINKSEVKSLHPTPLMRVVAIDQGHLPGMAAALVVEIHCTSGASNT